MSNICQSSFYFSLSIFSMTPTFGRAVRVQKCFLVPKRGVLTELLKLSTNACSYIFVILYVGMHQSDQCI